MKSGTAVLYFLIWMTGAFRYRHSQVQDRALNRLMDEGTLQEVNNGIARFEYKGHIFSVFVGGGIHCTGHLVEVDGKVIDESAMRRPSYRVMGKLQRMLRAEEVRAEKEKERAIREMLGALLDE